MPGTLTPDEFAALVADVRRELETADAETRALILARPRHYELESFRRYPNWREPIPRTRVAWLTGYAPSSVKVFRGKAARAREAGTETHRHMPAEMPEGGYDAGALAIWVAAKDQGKAAPLLADNIKAAQIRADYARRKGMSKGQLQAAKLTHGDIAKRHGVSVSLARKIGARRDGAQIGPLAARKRRRDGLLSLVRAIGERDGEVTYTGVAAELGIDRATATSLVDELGIPLVGELAGDPVVSAFIREVLRRPGRHKTAAAVYKRARAEGVKASPRQVARLLPLVRADVMAERLTPVGQGRARGESLRPDGLLTSAELAADWGVSSASITQARKRKDITPAKWEGNRPLWDPANMRSRSDRGQRSRTPVDKGHRLAVPLPGDEA